MTSRPEPELSGDGSTFEGFEPHERDDLHEGGPSSEAPDGPGSVEASSAGDGPEDVILGDFAALAKERDEYLTSLQRLQADFENYRKRVTRQQHDQAARAAVELVGKLLPVLDALDLAQAHLDTGHPHELSTEAQALVQARALLIDTLAREGLERVDAAGVVFDPQVHDAVAHQPAREVDGDGSTEPDVPREATVDEVLRSGYRWGGQVLRPAMVRVRG